MALGRAVSTAIKAASQAAKRKKDEERSSSSSSSSGGRGDRFVRNDGADGGTIMGNSYNARTGEVRDGHGNVIGKADSTEDFMRNYSSSGRGGGGSSYRQGAINASQYHTDRRALARAQQEILDRYRTETATIKDLQEKYGFDYSREYAERQAEAEAQARRNALKQQDRAVRSNLESGAEDLDRNYFLESLRQRQNQVGSGLNAGIAADQDARMAMARQAALGDMYRDTNLERARIMDELGLVDVEELARADALFNERLQQGFQNAMTLTDINRMINQQGFQQQMGLASATGQLGDVLLPQELQRRFENAMAAQQQAWQEEMDRAAMLGRLEGQDTMDRERLIAELTGRFQGNETVAEQQRLIENWLAEGQLTGNLGLTDEQQRLVTELLDLKRINETAGTDAATRRMNTLRADEIRQQLAMQGIDPSLFAADVRSTDALGNINRSRPTMDWRQLLEQSRQFDERLQEDRRQFDQSFREDQRQFDQMLDWEREQFENLSASQKEQFRLAQAQLDEQKRQFDTEQEWREYTYNNMSAAEKRQFDETARQFNEEMAWREYEFNETMKFQAGYTGGGGDYSSENFRESTKGAW